MSRNSLVLFLPPVFPSPTSEQTDIYRVEVSDTALRRTLQYFGQLSYIPDFLRKEATGCMFSVRRLKVKTNILAQAELQYQTSERG